MKAPNFISVEEAKRLPGLRLVLAREVPGPWSVAARLIFDIKGIPYAAVAHIAGEANEDIREWTGQASAPAAILDDERPRSGWSELLLLAEKIAPTPRLIPADENERAQMFGLCYELCGEDGFGWVARCLIFAAQQASGNVPYPSLIAKYASGHEIDHYSKRMNDVVALLDRQLARQAAVGSPYLVGKMLSAADLYWTAFSNMIDGMSEANCVMPDFFRQLGQLMSSYLDGPVPPALIRHRDFILDKYIDTPIRL